MADSWDPVVGTEEYEKTLDRARRVAGKCGYVLNEDEERVKKVIGLMTMNFIASGKYFCPCKQSHPLNPEKDVICPCPEIGDEVSAEGSCFCKLFFK